MQILVSSDHFSCHFFFNFFFKFHVFNKAPVKKNKQLFFDIPPAG